MPLKTALRSFLSATSDVIKSVMKDVKAGRVPDMHQLNAIEILTNILMNARMVAGMVSSSQGCCCDTSACPCCTTCYWLALSELLGNRGNELYPT